MPGISRWHTHECGWQHLIQILERYPDLCGSSGWHILSADENVDENIFTRSLGDTQICLGALDEAMSTQKKFVVTVTVAVGSSNCNCVGEEYNLYYIYNVQKVFYSTCKSMIWANLPIHSFMVGCLKLLPPRNECTGCFAPAQINRVLPFYVRNSHCSWLKEMQKCWLPIVFPFADLRLLANHTLGCSNEAMNVDEIVSSKRSQHAIIS